MLRSANMSLGINMLLKLVQDAFFAFYELMTSLISYIPAGFPFKNFAAEIAPFAKIALEYAVCFISTTSSIPAKIISCSPTIEPPRTEEIPSSFFSLFWRSLERLHRKSRCYH